MFSYTATIGRNVPTFTYAERDFHQDGDRITVSAPMSDERWVTFEGQVSALIASFARTWMAGTDVVELHRGKGVWNGVEEESTKVTLLTEMELGECALTDLRKALAYYALHYQQDAIALTIGQSELIEA